MKPHLIIKTARPLHVALPYWEEVLEVKNGVPDQILPPIDSILSRYNLPFWATLNYRPNTTNWNQDEIANGFNRIYRLILQRNQTIPDSLINELRLLPEIEFVRKGEISTSTLPESHMATASSLTSNYRDNGIFLKEVHLISKGSPEVKIAVLDTGIDLRHPELVPALLPGKDFVDIIQGTNQFIGDSLGIDNEPLDDMVGHGAHVAGIIAGQGINMPLGVAPKCKIIPVRVLGALQRGNAVVGAGLIDNINNGIKWAVDQGADIINMSLGVKHSEGGLPHEEVIAYALKKGVTVIAASGNDGSNDKYYPGALPGVIAVGAADDQGRIAPFSTYGGHVSLIAPGVNVYSSFINGGYAISSGTSQAAPFVSGGVALLKSIALSMGKRLYDRQVKYLLKHTSDKVSTQFKDEKAGFGRLNLLDAFSLMQYKI